MKITKNNIRKKILLEKYLANPTFYDNRRVIFDELIKKQKDGLITVKEIFEQFADLEKKLESPENYTQYPENIRHSTALRALYDNCNKDEVLAISLHQAILNNKVSEYWAKGLQEFRIKRAMFNILKKWGEVERFYNNIVVEQREYY